MKFTDLENIMEERGVHSLAEIARILNTTPQAVSNWKARDQVPFHIVDKIKSEKVDSDKYSIGVQQLPPNFIEESNSSNLSDILITVARHLKVIFLTTVCTVFISITYSWATFEVQYVSTAKILLPENKSSNALSGVASQFGINIQGNASPQNLSNPSLYPELVKSLTFGELILNEEFFSQKHNKKLSLLDILIYSDDDNRLDDSVIKRMAIDKFRNMVEFKNEGSFSLLVVTTNEPKFSRDLNVKVLDKLEDLSNFFVNQEVSQKIKFINNRIKAVGQELENSEQKLKVFRETNRQLSSPALLLEEERLSRDVEIQKEIFLTLKQQLELSNIENIQNESVVRILDMPQIPLYGSSRSLKLVLIISTIIGLIFGILLAFGRSYLDNSDIDERRKLRRVRNFLKKKSQDIFYDRRISGAITILMLFGSPFYLLHKSENPIYFGMYSERLMLLNAVYIFVFIFFSSLFIYLSKKNKIQ